MNSRLMRRLKLKLTQRQQQVPPWPFKFRWKLVIIYFPLAGVSRRAATEENVGGRQQVQARHGAGG
jgi:hypothetical protein